MMPPMQETVAREEPEIAPKNIDASETTAPRPPIIQPTREAATSTRRLASPPTLITTPERMKNGIAIIVSESTPVTEYDATMEMIQLCEELHDDDRCTAEREADGNANHDECDQYNEQDQCD